MFVSFAAKKQMTLALVTFVACQAEPGVAGSPVHWNFMMTGTAPDVGVGSLIFPSLDGNHGGADRTWAETGHPAMADRRWADPPASCGRRRG